MDNETLAIIADKLSDYGKLEKNAPMSAYTTYKTGGTADFLITPYSKAYVPSIIIMCRGYGINLTVIGGGSNLLVGDRGLPGVVLRIHADDDDGEITINTDGTCTVPAGISKDRWIEESIAAGFGGVLFAAGIPGTVGGGIVMNAGTTMGCFADNLTSVEIVSAEGGRKTVTIDSAGTGYRTMGLPAGAVILSGTFNLPRAEAGAGKLLQEKQEIIDGRWTKHPLQYPSAGSVFKNPEGHYSWKLINDAGLKGYRIGGAQVSELHTNFIINTGNATSADIRDLIELVQLRVAEEFGITLETEVRMIGLF